MRCIRCGYSAYYDEKHYTHFGSHMLYRKCDRLECGMTWLRHPLQGWVMWMDARTSPLWAKVKEGWILVGPKEAS